jgi:hypothetical protein
MNPSKIIRETPPVESPDVVAAMEPTFKASDEQLDNALIAALLAACAMNLMMVCTWL